MYNSVVSMPFPTNEPNIMYEKGSIHRQKIEEALKEISGQQVEVPLIIGGKEIKTGDMGEMIEPHKHASVLGKFHKAGKKEVEMAIQAALKAQKEWELMSFEQRAAIFLKAAELLSTKYRYEINAITMLNQSKNVFQAEIDAACELIDFLRFNVYFMRQIYEQQPMHNPKGVWNYVQYRPIEGFVFAVTPFNFTAIGGNLPTAPAMMGNVVVWKPASTAVYACYKVMKILEEAGLPAGVINFVPGSGAKVGNPALQSPDLAGIHFTGSTGTFQNMWKTIGNNIHNYKNYPRIVGETGGKDFIVAHPSAQVEPLATAITRGAFEYQGQKCSAASRAYIPKSLWPELKQLIKRDVNSLKMGDVRDNTNFVNAVIDKASFENCKAYLQHAKDSDDAEILLGGGADDSVGYFVEPTVIVAKDPKYKSMVEEIFGPIITIYVYEDEKFDEILEVCDQTSIYALTGAIFSQDRMIANKAVEALRHSAGNFYINDKPTGSIVGQQPFGGARGSGTDDKAGSAQNLMRWVTTRSIKETFNPPTDYRYPFLEE